MAFLITKCHECGTDCAVFDDGTYMQCKCGLSPDMRLTKPATKSTFKRPQLLEDIAND